MTDPTTQRKAWQQMCNALDYILEDALYLPPWFALVLKQRYWSVNNLLVLSEYEIDNLTYHKPADGDDEAVNTCQVPFHLKATLKHFQAWVFFLFGKTHPKEQLHVNWMDSNIFNEEEFDAFRCGINYHPDNFVVPEKWLKMAFNHNMNPPVDINSAQQDYPLIVSSPIPEELASYAPFATAFPLLGDRHILNVKEIKTSCKASLELTSPFLYPVLKSNHQEDSDSSKTTSDSKCTCFLKACDFDDWFIPAKHLHVAFSSCDNLDLNDPIFVQWFVSWHDGMASVDCWMAQNFVFDRGRDSSQYRFLRSIGNKRIQLQLREKGSLETNSKFTVLFGMTVITDGRRSFCPTWDMLALLQTQQWTIKPCDDNDASSHQLLTLVDVSAARGVIVTTVSSPPAKFLDVFIAAPLSTKFFQVSIAAASAVLTVFDQVAHTFANENMNRLEEFENENTNQVEFTNENANRDKIEFEIEFETSHTLTNEHSWLIVVEDKITDTFAKKYEDEKFLLSDVDVTCDTILRITTNRGQVMELQESSLLLLSPLVFPLQSRFSTFFHLITVTTSWFGKNAADRQVYSFFRLIVVRCVKNSRDFVDFQHLILLVSYYLSDGCSIILLINCFQGVCCFPVVPHVLPPFPLPPEPPPFDPTYCGCPLVRSTQYVYCWKAGSIVKSFLTLVYVTCNLPTRVISMPYYEFFLTPIQ